MQIIENLKKIHTLLIIFELFIFLLILSPNNLSMLEGARDDLRIVSKLGKMLVEHSDYIKLSENKERYYKFKSLQLLKRKIKKQHEIDLDIENTEFTSSIKDFLLLDDIGNSLHDLFKLMDRTDLIVVIKFPDLDQIVNDFKRKELEKSNTYQLKRIEITQSSKLAKYRFEILDSLSNEFIIEGDASIKQYLGKHGQKHHEADMSLGENILTGRKWKRVTSDSYKYLSEPYIWKNISDKSPEEALEFIEDSIRSEVTLLNFYGLSMPISLSIYVFPVISFFLQLYFLSHMLHLIDLPLNRDYKFFPWIALYSNFLSRIITLSTLFILPYTLNSIFLFKRRNLLSNMEMNFIFVMIILMMITSIIIYKQYIMFYKKLGSIQ